MVETSVECIVVGGGIGGAVLALALGKKGKRVVLLEREPKLAGTARPEVLAGLTMETFQKLGVGERMVREAAVPLEGLELYEKGPDPVLRLGRDDFKRAGASPFSTDPARTRTILLEEAQRTGFVEVHRGVEVREILMEGPRVAGVRAVREGTFSAWKAGLVVGDDGGESRVRKAMGISLATREFPLEFLGTVDPAGSSPVGRMGQARLNPRGLRGGIFGVISMPLPEERRAFAFILSERAYARFLKDPGRFYEEASELSPLCSDLKRHRPFPEGFGHFRRPFGHAPRYVSDGAALLGDAAHPVTPAGGQGANMSVSDAMALADVALEVFRQGGEFSARRLASYEQMRRRPNERSLQFSIRANLVFRALKGCPWLMPVLLGYLRRVNHSPNTKARFIRAVSSAFSTEERSTV